MGFGKKIAQLFVPEPHKGVRNRKHLTTLSLACLIFFEVSGGPYGTEDAIGAAGAKYTLLGFLVLPILWCIPEALITAEYTTAFPEAMGGAAWAGAAFGSFWAWMSAWLTFVSGMVGLAAYPVLIVEYLALQWPELGDGWRNVLVLCAITVIMFSLNYIGLEVVGIAQVVNMIFIMSPFAVMLFYCIPHWDTDRWGQVVKPTDWETWINVMFWSLNYWSCISNLADEVIDPNRTIPKALAFAVPMVAASYLLPYGMVTAVLTKTADDEWSVGYLGQAARMVAGRGLMVWVILGAIGSALGLFLAALTTDAYQLHGLALRGFLPDIFARRGRFDTPTWAIWVQLIPVCLLVNLEFTAILSMINTTYAASLVITFTAGLTMRFTRPDLPRPFRVPVNAVGFVGIMLPGMALLGWVLVIPFYKVQKDILLCLLGTIVVGFIMWFLMKIPALRRALLFRSLDLDWEKHCHICDDGVLPQAALEATKDPAPAVKASELANMYGR